MPGRDRRSKDNAPAVPCHTAVSSPPAGRRGALLAPRCRRVPVRRAGRRPLLIQRPAARGCQPGLPRRVLRRWLPQRSLPALVAVGLASLVLP